VLFYGDHNHDLGSVPIIVMYAFASLDESLWWLSLLNGFFKQAANTLGRIKNN